MPPLATGSNAPEETAATLEQRIGREVRTLRTRMGHARAREFYEAQDFVVIQQTDGDNEEHEPDVRYEWKVA